MTKHEAIVAGAYTGILFPGTEFSDIHEYVEIKLGRPVFTHEFAIFRDEIKEATKSDFLSIKVC